MKIKIILLSFVLSFGLSSSAHALVELSNLKVASYIKFCKAAMEVNIIRKSQGKVPAKTYMRASLCMSYMSAVIDTHFAYSMVRSKFSKKPGEVYKYFVFCIPNGVRSIDRVQVVLDYLQQRPKIHTQRGVAFYIMMAFRKAYPCRQ